MSSVIIWDFDGTLAYRHGGAWSAALVEAAAQQALNLRVTAGQLHPYLQTGFPWLAPERPHPEIGTADAWWSALEPVFQRAYVGAGIEKDVASVLARKVRSVYLDPQRWRLFDDVVPALEKLSASGWAHAILSNHVPELRQIVAHLGLDAHVGHVINSAETGYEKPHPQAFRFVLEAVAGVTNVVMIGDSMAADIEGARAMGIPAILVRVPSAGYEFYSPGLSEISAVLEQVWGSARCALATAGSGQLGSGAT